MSRYLVFTLILFLPALCFSQEKQDSLDLNYEYSESAVSPLIFDHTFFSIYYPLRNEFTVNNRMNRMIFGELDKMSEYQSFSYTSNNFYQFYSNGFHFWENVNPLILGASIHFNEVFDWDKLDIFMDTQGVLYNVYDIESNVFTPTNERAFSWGAGAGVGYKVSKGNTIFIKASVSMDKFVPIGNTNLSGVNMKF